MILAHTAVSGGGPSVEMLVLAAGLLVLGGVLFVQKTAKTSVSVLLITGALALGAGSFALGGGGGSDSPDVTVAIESPGDGATVPAGEPVAVEVGVEGGSLTNALTSDDPSEGHLHIFVDGQIISMPATTTGEVMLEPGRHTIDVEFVGADHHPFEPRIIDSIFVTAE